MRAEPGLGIFFVRIGAEAWIRKERIRRPFPDVADHLAAAEGAVAARMGADFDQAAGAPVEIGGFGTRRPIAPRVMAPARAQVRAADS